MNAPERKMPEEQVSKEMLMMYGDGTLPLDQRKFVTAALMRDPELVRELESYLFTRDLPVLRETMEVPAWLVAAVTKGGAPGKPRLLDWVRRSGRAPVWALAAAIAILLAGASGWLLRGAAHPDFVHHDERGLVAAGALQRALETTPVGETASLAGDLSIRPRSTFFTVHKRWYRHYDLLYGRELQAPGLAYRGPDGSWRVLQQAEAARPAPDGRVLGPETGLIEALRDKIIVDGVLTREEEKTLINEHWRRKP